MKKAQESKNLVNNKKYATKYWNNDRKKERERKENKQKKKLITNQNLRNISSNNQFKRISECHQHFSSVFQKQSLQSEQSFLDFICSSLLLFFFLLFISFYASPFMYFFWLFFLVSLFFSVCTCLCFS